MKRSLILHIGAGKSGSSAIQRFLKINAGILAKLGHTVPAQDLSPDGKVTGQHLPFIQALPKDLQESRKILSERVRDVMNRIPVDGRVIMSAENLSNPDSAPQAFAPLADAFDIRAIFYIRRQDEFLLSSWQQWPSKVINDFWAWAIAVVGELGNWRQILQMWEQVVPRDRITVRIYEKSRFPQQDINRDFIGALGLSAHAGKFEFPANSVNPTYSDAIVELVKGNRFLFKNIHDNDFYNTVETLTGDKFHRNGRESVITFKQRQALLNRYAATNEWVKQSYFPSLERLFSPPRPGDYVFINAQEIEERKWEVMISLFHALSKRVLE